MGTNPWIHEWVTKIRNNCGGSFEWTGNHLQTLQTPTVLHLNNDVATRYSEHTSNMTHDGTTWSSQWAQWPKPFDAFSWSWLQGHCPRWTPSIHHGVAAGAALNNARPWQRLRDVPREFCSLHTPAHPHICSCTSALAKVKYKVNDSQGFLMSEN